MHVTPAVGDEPASIEADLHEVTLAAISAAVVSAGGTDPLSVLPPAIASFVGALAIGRVRVAVDLSARVVTEVSVVVASDQPLPLIPGQVEIAGPIVTLVYTRAGDSHTVAVVGTGTLLGSAVQISVVRTDDGTFAISLAGPDGTDMAVPSVEQLAGLVGAADATSVLPAQLGDAAGLSISTLELTMSGAGVDSLHAAVTTTRSIDLPDPFALSIQRLTHRHRRGARRRRRRPVRRGHRRRGGPVRRRGHHDDDHPHRRAVAADRLAAAGLDPDRVGDRPHLRRRPARAPARAGPVRVHPGRGVRRRRAHRHRRRRPPNGPCRSAPTGSASARSRSRSPGTPPTPTAAPSPARSPARCTSAASSSRSPTRARRTAADRHRASFAPFALLQDLCGATVVGSLALPPELLALALTDLELTIDVDRSEASVRRHRTRLQAGPGGRPQGHLLGLRRRHRARRHLPVLLAVTRRSAASTGVHLPDALIVISTFDDTAFRFDELQPVAGTGVDPRPAGRRPARPVRSGRRQVPRQEPPGRQGARRHHARRACRWPPASATSTITDGVVLKDAEFELVPDPENVSISVSGAVDVTIDASPLEFIGGVRVVPNGISFFATMKGTWNDPFGAKGVALTDVSLEIGSDFEGVPSIGITGGLQIGAFAGKAAVSFNSELPTQSVLIVAFNHLSLMDVVGTFCPPSVSGRDPGGRPAAPSPASRWTTSSCTSSRRTPRSGRSNTTRACGWPAPCTSRGSVPRRRWRSTRPRGFRRPAR